MTTTQQVDPAKLEEAIARLPEGERRVLLLGASQGLSTDEIAARLGISPRAAKRRLARALRRLDRRLEGDRPWWRPW